MDNKLSELKVTIPADKKSCESVSALQEMGGWESIEMVQRYAHLAPNHLTEHARQIDAIFGGLVPNLSHVEIEKLG